MGFYWLENMHIHWLRYILEMDTIYSQKYMLLAHFFSQTEIKSFQEVSSYLRGFSSLIYNDIYGEKTGPWKGCTVYSMKTKNIENVIRKEKTPMTALLPQAKLNVVRETGRSNHLASRTVQWNNYGEIAQKIRQRATTIKDYYKEIQCSCKNHPRWSKQVADDDGVSSRHIWGMGAAVV